MTDADVPPPLTQFAVRSNENTQVFTGPPEFRNIKSFSAQDIIVTQGSEDVGTEAHLKSVAAAVAAADTGSVTESSENEASGSATESSSAQQPTSEHAGPVTSSLGESKLNVTSPPFVPAVQMGSRPEVKSFLYDKQGKFLAWLLSDTVKIFDSGTDELVLEIKEEKVIDFSFSPQGSYISTWTRFNPNTTEENGHQHCNLKVWQISTGNCVVAYTHKAQAAWEPNWTFDEAWFARLAQNQISFYRTTDFSKVAYTLKKDHINQFSLSPGKRPIVAIFVPEKNAQPARVMLYDIGSFNQPVAHKSFFKADSVTFHWNDLGTNVLVFTHTDVDKTGKSYYGETNLYYLSISGTFDCRVDLAKPGPIHDVAWSPNSMEFIVVYGTMPSKATLFNNRAKPIYEFGERARNTVKYSPVGRLLFLAGFGNLLGDVEIWDRQTCKRLATINCANSSSCEWSPDGKYFMTSILYKRLKVDNGIKIYHHSGSLIYKLDSKELYQAAWRPAPKGIYPPIRSLSPPPKSLVAEVSKPKTSSGVYVPPSARGRAGADKAKPRQLSKMTPNVSSVFGSGSESLRNQSIPGLNPDKLKKKPPGRK